MSCPTDEVFAQFAAGALDIDDRSNAADHLDGCADCRELLAVLAGDSVIASDATELPDGGAQTIVASSSPRDELLTDAEVLPQIGRYVTLDHLGSGAMGVVFAAYDPTLDRKVAIKILQLRSTKATRQLSLEAKALARLSHPNVVTAYEVGSWGGQEYVAMEFIDGTTLSKWLSGEKRSWREVVRTLIEAGQGLTAAHKAGLVHRDFKPSNVLVGADGRIRVTDFGLARDADSNEDRPPSESSGSVPITAETITGTMLGTPAYMSPEQHVGRRATARSDQFSFCVSLFEALYGVRPFEGDTLALLADNISNANVVTTPADSAVPQWLRKIVDRGMSTNPADRFDSMSELLAALATDPRVRRRRRITVAGLVVGVLGLAALAAYGNMQRNAQTTDTRSQLCTGAAGEMATVWNANVKQRMRGEFAKTNKSYAHTSFEAVARGFDRFATSWVAMRTDACTATHVRGTQSDAILDVRMQCLNRRLAQGSAVVDVFSNQVDARLVTRALKTPPSLPTVSDCADIEHLTATRPPPRSATARVAIDKAHALLARARALRETGQYNKAVPVAERAAAVVADIDYPQASAEAAFMLARLHEMNGSATKARAALERAALLAAHAHDDKLVAHSWIRMLSVVGVRLEQPKHAQTLQPIVEAAVVRAGDPPTLRALLLTHNGLVAKTAGKTGEAQVLLTRALAMHRKAKRTIMVANALNELAQLAGRSAKYEIAAKHYAAARAIYAAAYGPNHPRVAALHNNMGTLALGLGHTEQAITSFSGALTVMKTVLAPNHPSLAALHNNLGVVTRMVGRREQARPHLLEALRIYETRFGKNHADVAMVLTTLGGIDRQAGNFKVAERRLRRAMQIRRDKLGATHHKVGASMQELALILITTGKHAEAERVHAEAAQIYRATSGPYHLDYAVMLLNWGEVSLSVDKARRAHSSCTQSAKIYRKATAPHPNLTYALVCAGRAGLRVGKTTSAVANLKAAHALIKNVKPTPKLARTQFQLAIAMMKSNQNKSRWRNIARGAIEQYAATGGSKTDLQQLNERLAAAR